MSYTRYRETERKREEREGEKRGEREKKVTEKRGSQRGEQEAPRATERESNASERGTEREREWKATPAEQHRKHETKSVSVGACERQTKDNLRFLRLSQSPVSLSCFPFLHRSLSPLSCSNSPNPIKRSCSRCSLEIFLSCFFSPTLLLFSLLIGYSLPSPY